MVHWYFEPSQLHRVISGLISTKPGVLAVTVVIEREPGSPTLNLFKVLDVLLEIWVPGTGCIFQDGSNYSDIGSCSDFDTAVSQVPSQNTKHSVILSSCYGDMPGKVTPRYLLSLWNRELERAVHM